MLTFLSLSFTLTGNTQGTVNLRNSERELRDLFKEISQALTDSQKIASSIEFSERLRSALQIEGSAEYPWDSLRYMAKITSPDGLFRLYNWNVPLTGGGNRYFCLIQFRKAWKKIPPCDLRDFSDSVTEPEKFTGDSLHWYGALYYDIIPYALRDNSTSYILLGWDGISKDMSSKVIDVLTFKSSGCPGFGSMVFPDFRDGRLFRIIFRYSSSASMSLRYRLQTIPGKPVWNSRKKEYQSDNISVKMIVFDHLVPMDPQLEGQYKFYIPSSETAEGFKYDNNSWRYIKEFDARNP
jgi:hypothetical protein